MREVGVIEDGAMLVSRDRIQWVGRRADIEIPKNYEVFDAEGGVVLPGFVDAHTHLIFGGNRANEFAARAEGATYEEIAARGGGIRSTVAATRHTTEDELVKIGEAHARKALGFGTTTAEAKSGYGLSVEHELRLLRAICRLGGKNLPRISPTFLGAHAFPPEFEDDREAYVRLILEEMLPKAAPLAAACDVFVEKGYFEIDQARRILERAMELGLHVHMHLDQLCDGGGGAFAAEIGKLSWHYNREFNVTADHLEHTPAEAFPAMAAAPVIPVLLPASVFCLGKTKYPDARGMIDAGMAVVLASDFNPGSSPTLSIPFVMSLAMTHMRMSAEEALVACTVNPGAVLASGMTGLLEVGKEPDFTVWPCEDWREIPYWVAMTRPSAVFVAGQRAPI